jgi:hypothetical protein
MGNRMTRVFGYDVAVLVPMERKRASCFSAGSKEENSFLLVSSRGHLTRELAVRVCIYIKSCRQKRRGIHSADGRNLQAIRDSTCYENDLALWQQTCIPRKRIEHWRHEMSEHGRRHWRELCAAVSNERDSSKLSFLVQELIEALDEPQRKSGVSVIPTGNGPDAALSSG